MFSWKRINRVLVDIKRGMYGTVGVLKYNQFTTSDQELPFKQPSNNGFGNLTPTPEPIVLTGADGI